MAQCSDNRRQGLHITTLQCQLHAVRQGRTHLRRAQPKGRSLDGWPMPFLANHRHSHLGHAALSLHRQIGRTGNLNRDKRRRGRLRQGSAQPVLLYPLPEKVRVHSMVKREPRYRNPCLKPCRNKSILPCGIVTTTPIARDKGHVRPLVFCFHNVVSTSLGGHFLRQSTQYKKVQGKERLRATPCKSSIPRRCSSPGPPAAARSGLAGGAHRLCCCTGSRCLVVQAH